MTKPKKRVGWPLGFQPTFDEIAVEVGLSHWSCLDPKGNQWWMRRDGHIVCINAVEGWPFQLRQIDRNIVTGKPLKIFFGKSA